MDPPASRRRVFESKAPPSPPPTHPPPLSPYLEPYSSAPFAPSRIPRSGSAEFVRMSRGASTPRDSPTTESPGLTSTLIASGYDVGTSSTMSINSLGSSGALNALSTEPNQQQSGSSVSERAIQQTFHLEAVEYPLEQPNANYEGRVTSEYSNVNLPNSRRGFVGALPDRHTVPDMVWTCSCCSQRSGEFEFDFADTFSPDPVTGGAHSEGDIGTAVLTPPVPNPYQAIELPNSAPTPSPVHPALAGFSSRSGGSASRSGRNLLPAPSGQFAGSPSTHTLPVLINREPTALQGIPSSPTVVGSLDTSMYSVEGDAQAPYHTPSLTVLSRPVPENRITPGPLRRRRSGYFIPAVGVEGGVVLRSGPIGDDTNDLSYSEADTHSESPVDESSVHSHRATSDVGQVRLFPKQHLAPIEPSSSLNQIYINARGPNSYEQRKTSPNVTPLPTPTSSNGVMDSGNVGREQSSWTLGALDWDHPSPTSHKSAGAPSDGVPRPPTRQSIRGVGTSSHLGERGDRHSSGVNDSYELADLGAAGASSVVIEARGTRHRPSLATLFGSVKDFKKCKLLNNLQPATKKKWGYSALGIVLLVVMVVLVVIFAGGPIMYRRAIEDTKFDIQSLNLDNLTPESLSVQVKMGVEMRDRTNLTLGPTFYYLGTNNSLAPGQIHASIESMLSVLPEASVFEPEATLFGKRFIGEMAPYNVGNQSKVEDLGAMYRPGILGTFETEGAMVTSGKGVLGIGGTVSLGVNGDLRLEDPRAWAGLLTALLYHERLELRVTGSILAKFLWVWRRLEVSKRLPINGMNGFKGFQIQNHSAFTSPSGQFTVELTWYNPSQISLTLPRIEFDLLVEGHKIGNSTISSMLITPGNNILTGFTGSLDPIIFRNNRTLLSRYLSSFIAQANGKDFSLLQLQGVAAITNNKELHWLSPAIERMTFDLPLIGRDPAHSGPTNPLGESFKWDFVFVAGMSMLELTNGTLSSTFTLPFESAMFPVYIEDACWDLTISNHQGPFLRIVNNFGSSGNEILNLGENSHSIQSRLGKHTLVDVLEKEIWNMYFTRDFVGKTAVHLSITSTVTLKVVTPLGNATVSGLDVQDEPWDIRGLAGLDNGGKSPAEILYPIAFEYRQWMVGFGIYNPSAIQIALGASTFAMYLDSDTGCFGVLKVKDLNLTRGWSNLTGAVQLDEGRCTGDGFGDFLSKVVAGGIYYLTAEFVDCQYASSNRPFITGFELQRFDAVLHSTKYLLFDSLEIQIQRDGVKVVITLANGVSSVMSFTLIDLVIPGLTEGAGVNSTIKSTGSGSTNQLPQVDLTSKFSAADTANSLNQFIGQDMKLDIAGKLGIDWNGVQTVINYGQQDTPVHVRRIMA